VDLAAGDLATSQITTLDVAGAGQTIQLSTTSGTITVDDVTGFNVNTADDNFVLTTAGVTKDIAFTGGTLTAASATLTATGAITHTGGATDIDTSAAGGTITLSGTSLGATGAGNALELTPGAGTLSLTASTDGVFVDLAAGDLATSQITTLDVAGAGQTIQLSPPAAPSRWTT